MVLTSGCRISAISISPEWELVCERLVLCPTCPYAFDSMMDSLSLSLSLSFSDLTVSLEGCVSNSLLLRKRRWVVLWLGELERDTDRLLSLSIDVVAMVDVVSSRQESIGSIGLWVGRAAATSASLVRLLLASISTLGLSSTIDDDAAYFIDQKVMFNIIISMNYDCIVM